jgi:hypothetical protein
VVDVSGFVSVKSRVDDVLVVQSEHVAVIVSLLPFVTNWMSNLFANILNHNILRVEPKLLLGNHLLLQGKEAIPVNFTPPDFNCFRILLCSPVLHRRIHIVTLGNLKV